MDSQDAQLSFKKIHKCQTQHAPQIGFSGSQGSLIYPHER
jgi:hypothetical protein